MPGYPAVKGVANTFSATMGQHSFAQIPHANIQRSAFNRSHKLLTAFNSGYLIPIFVDEALPGDTFKLKTTSFVRMTTPLFPVMDNLYMDVFYFAVPYRLVWDNFIKMMGEQRNPGDSINFQAPIFSSFTPASLSLSDYFGIPARGVAYDYIVSLWHRAYNLVWNEWFRDENLQNSVVVDVDDGPDAIADYVLLRRGKRHDYFTSALPFTQKGTAPTLTFSGTAPVISTGSAMTFQKVGDASVFGTFKTLGGAGNVAPLISTGGAAWGGVDIEYRGGLVANLAAATGQAINDIRNAFQIQKLLERDARGGTRYTEIVRSHFGVVSPDARLQRPEYLGGGTTRVNIHPVPRTQSGATANTNAGGSIGQLGGFATAGIDGIGFNKSFTEHTLILGLVNVRADITYQQGINKMFTRRSRYEFYWPEFAHLGEQSVLNREIWANGDANDLLVFGYQERYAEYRYKPSIVTASMSSNYATPLDVWHLGLNFAALPALNATFIADQPPMSRVLAVTTQQEFFGDFWFDMHCARPMPMFGVPGLIDHF